MKDVFTPKSELFNNFIERITIFIFFLFLLILTVARWPSFAPLVISHDESTYIVMARDWWAGKTMYKDIIDIKSPGIFLILGLFQELGINSVWALRFMTTFIVSTSAFLIYLISINCRSSYTAAFLSELAFLSLFIKPLTLSINTEQYFIFFNLLGLYFHHQFIWPDKILATSINVGNSIFCQKHKKMDFSYPTIILCSAFHICYWKRV